MLDGNWIIHFGVPSDYGNGVIAFQEGKIFGGDSSFYYFGKYSPLKNHKYKAEASVRRHSPGPGIYPGRDNYELYLEGNVTNDAFDFIGVPDFAPSSQIIVMGKKLTKC